MGMNARAEIACGYPCAEDAGLPWGDDIEQWWREINGYKAPFELYDETGNWLNGKKPEKKVIDEYYNHRREWEKQNPLPVELCFTGSHDYSLAFLAVPGERQSVDWGEFLDLSETLVTPDSKKIGALEKFVSEHDIKVDRPLGWHMFAFYG